MWGQKRGQRNVTLLAVKTEKEAVSRGLQLPLEAGKDKDMDSLEKSEALLILPFLAQWNLCQTFDLWIWSNYFHILWKILQQPYTITKVLSGYLSYLLWIHLVSFPTTFLLMWQDIELTKHRASDKKKKNDRDLLICLRK